MKLVRRETNDRGLRSGRRPGRLGRMIRKASSRTALVLPGLLVGLTVVEGSARWVFFGSLAAPTGGVHYRQPHEQLGWSLAPNATAYLRKFDYVNVVHINSKGFHDVEHTYTVPGERFQILVLGDSFMEAYTEPLGGGFSQLLERELSSRTALDVEVINLGVGGYGTTQEYLLFQAEEVKYDPDLILLAFFGQNDVRDNPRALEAAFHGGSGHYRVAVRPFLERVETGDWELIGPDLNAAKELLEERRVTVARQHTPTGLERFLLGQLLLRSIQAVAREERLLPGGAESMYGIYQVRPSRVWNEAWEATEELLERLRDAVGQSGARLAVFSVPAACEADAAYWDHVVGGTPWLRQEVVDLERPEARLAESLAGLEIPFRPLLGTFRDKLEEDGISLHHIYEDLHWNGRGHELAARAVAGWLTGAGLLDINR